MRHKKRNRHHIRAKARARGKMWRDHRSNLLLIDVERHEAWHTLFGLLDINEAIELLTRVQRAKKAQRE